MLSQDLRLCPHVRSLHINGTVHDILGSELKWERNASGLIITPQESIQRWQDILLRLVNCQSFHVYKHFTPVRPSKNLDPCDTITILLSIITAIERPLRDLSILFVPPDCTGGHLIDMSRVDKALLREPKFITTSLEALTFRYSMDTEETVDFVIQFIQHATHLQRLRIDADYGDYSTTIISRLQSTTLRLRELTLETGHVGSSDVLITFLASSKQSLAKVSFACIQLDSGEWASVLQALSKFPSLMEISTHLLGQGRSRIHFPAVMQDPIVDPVLGTKFSYTARKLRQGPRTLMVAYSGHGMDIALQKLAEFATPWRIGG
ncbi:hypothetical protein BDW59DRAFT_155465 [Aspergillus cavernicola]|uniref:F-box domain-containing protein n=1 Tax=Aspergillus cavernicola TaxID=176166 RepID=A0ABR4HAL2_9EURO